MPANCEKFALGDRFFAMDHLVVVIGDALIDEFSGAQGTTESVGGAALNVATGLRILGTASTLIAMIGADAEGERIRNFLLGHNVSLQETVSPSGTSRALSERVRGEPHYRFNQAAMNRKIHFAEAELAAIAAAEYVVVSCFPFDDDEQVAALEGCIDRPEERLIIDPNPRVGMMRDLPAFVRNCERLATKSLLFKLGEDDARVMYESELDGIVEKLLSSGVKNVLATEGRRGARVHVARAPAVYEPVAAASGEIVDTMGAGDATLAAVVHSFVNTGFPGSSMEWQAVLHRAMRVAAATCRVSGGTLQLPENSPLL